MRTSSLHALLEEKAFTKDKPGSGRCRAVRPEQESVSWMKSLPPKYSNTAQVLLDPYVGTFVMDKACMLVPKYLRFVGCEIEAACFDASMPSVVEIFGRHVLNDKSVNSGSDRL